MQPRHKLVDYYGKPFNKEDIVNGNAIGFVESRDINQLTEEEIRSSTVLIEDKNQKHRLYLLSDLLHLLKANYYVRLVDPFTRKDLLEELPPFKKRVVEFENQAANYNASVLGKYPHFIDLLKTYVEVILDPEDAHRYRDADPNDIAANHSERLETEFYSKIREFSEEELEAFNSLFITNRDHFYDPQKSLFEFPAKWVRTAKNASFYDYFTITQKSYTSYPFRNVLVGDAFGHPDAACMHSWGMDIFHLLLEYHIGTGEHFSIFKNADANPFAYKMERALSGRIQQETPAGSLNPIEGVKAHQCLKLFVQEFVQENEIRGLLRQAIQNIANGTVLTTETTQIAGNHFLRDLKRLEMQILSDIQNNKLSLEDAKSLATSTKDLAAKVADCSIKNNDIDSFKTATKAYKKTSLLDKILSALIGAAIGILIGVAAGIATGPGVVLTSAYGGVQGAMLGVSLGSSVVLGITSAWYSMWFLKKNHPLTQLEKAAKTIEAGLSHKK